MRWFKPFGLIFLPISIPGWIVSALAAAFCLHIFLFVDARSHSVSDMLYGVFPYWVPTFLLWIWIATQTSSACESKASR
ncbi:MAG: hypothetical protein WAM89_19270 [Terriglobales bacterium]